MQKKTKKLLKISGFGLAVALFATACTANFCSPKDQAHMLYQKDSGIVSKTGDVITHAPAMEKIVAEAAAQGYTIPTTAFFEEMDAKVLAYANVVYAEANSGATATPEVVLAEFGYVKFLGNKQSDALSQDKYLFGNWNYWVREIAVDKGAEFVPDKDFTAFYQSSLEKSIGNQRACIALAAGEYGPTGEKIPVEAKSWNYAFSKGPIEGLLVYPVAAMVEFFSIAFGANGWGQMLAILLVTIIVRGLMIAFTFKSTLSQQKMTALQPEIAKLQEKYPNSSTNNYEKQALAQAQMALYKKHGVKPFSQFIVMFVQFPIFIAVWGALTGSAILASDDVWGLNLNASLGTEMTKNFFSSAWWVAIVLFILMAVSQFVSMKLPQWLQKSKKKDVTKLGKNPSANQQAKQGKMMMTIMYVFILIMSWSLPAAMGVYWLVGALISIAQTSITQQIMNRKKK